MTLRQAQGRRLRQAQGRPLRQADGPTIGDVLREGRRALAEGGIEDAGLEAEVILRHALAIDRARLFAHLDDPMDPARAAAYDGLLARRLAREPTAYITGRREFYGLDFDVTTAVLIPRPETELLVELALGFAGSRARGQGSGVPDVELRVADVGTGCGAVAVALAVHLPGALVVATDTSREALLVAARNAARHGVADRIALLQTDLLAGPREPFDLAVANLPYVPAAEWASLPPEVRDYEPRAALDGGADGLSAIGRLLAAAPAHLAPGGALLLEIGHGQGEAALGLARDAFPHRDARLVRDGAGRRRVVAVR